MLRIPSQGMVLILLICLCLNSCNAHPDQRDKLVGKWLLSELQLGEKAKKFNENDAHYMVLYDKGGCVIDGSTGTWEYDVKTESLTIDMPGILFGKTVEHHSVGWDGKKMILTCTSSGSFLGKVKATYSPIKN